MPENKNRISWTWKFQNFNRNFSLKVKLYYVVLLQGLILVGKETKLFIISNTLCGKNILEIVDVLMAEVLSWILITRIIW